MGLFIVKYQDHCQNLLLAPVIKYKSNQAEVQVVPVPDYSCPAVSFATVAVALNMEIFAQLCAFPLLCKEHQQCTGGQNTLFSCSQLRSFFFFYRDSLHFFVGATFALHGA